MLRCQCLSVRLSVTEVHWRIIANLVSNSDPDLPRIAVAVHAAASTELFIVQWVRGKDHRREEWSDHLALC